MRLPFDVDLPASPELEVECASPVTGNIVLTNTWNLLVIQGELTAALRTTCPRCLAEVTTEMPVPVDDEFTIANEFITGRADDDSGMADPATAALWKEGHVLNLTELVRQSIVLALPMEPLCREDCKGLCPICGANRNETECKCEQPVDSPFAALAGLSKHDAD
jgi:uncharacterized protein